MSKQIKTKQIQDMEAGLVNMIGKAVTNLHGPAYTVALARLNSKKSFVAFYYQAATEAVTHYFGLLLTGEIVDASSIRLDPRMQWFEAYVKVVEGKHITHPFVKHVLENMHSKLNRDPKAVFAITGQRSGRIAQVG